jgi:hypothetical protein
MRRRLLTLIGILSPAIVVASVAVHAQTSAASHRTGTPPRTAWGDPDLRGVWEYATMTPLERARELAEKATFTEQEAAAYERQFLERQENRATIVGGPDWWDEVHLANRRTSLIVDPPNGRIPPLTPEAQKRAAALAQARSERGAADSIEDLGLNVRCLQWASTGPPMLPFIFNNNVQIFQTRQYVTIYNEMIHAARIVPMDGRPHGTIRQWMGDSRGHWEGSTLVVDTVNFSDKTNFRGSGANLHLVERFTRTGGGTIEYRFTVEDPTVWTQSWTAVIPMRATAGPIFEFACHEGNARSIEGILGSARAEEKEQDR